MRKHVYGRQFKRDVNERKALFRGLLEALVLHEQIKTTEEKAKAIRRDADKLVTKARKERLHALSLLQPDLSHHAVRKMIDLIAPRFEGRNGGYTRVIRLAPRRTDSAKMAVIEWVEKRAETAKISEKGVKSKTKAITSRTSEAKTEKKIPARKTAKKAAVAKKTPAKKAKKEAK